MAADRATAVGLTASTTLIEFCVCLIHGANSHHCVVCIYLMAGPNSLHELAQSSKFISTHPLS